MTVHMKKPLAVVAHDASAAAHPGSARSTTNAATAPTTTPRNPSAVAGNRNRTGIPAHAGANRGNGADGHGAIASTATVANKTGKTMMTVSQLAMLTVVAVASLRSLPAMAIMVSLPFCCISFRRSFSWCRPRWWLPNWPPAGKVACMCGCVRRSAIASDSSPFGCSGFRMWCGIRYRLRSSPSACRMCSAWVAWAIMAYMWPR